MAAHLHWRLNFTASIGGSPYITLTGIEFREAAGGTNYAIQGVYGSASASSEFGAGNPATAAADNNGASSWSSASGLPHWWRFSLAVARDIKHVTLVGATYTAELPGTFSLQWSDDASAWTTAETWTEAAAWASNETRSYSVAGTVEPVRVRKLHGFAVLSPPPSSVAVAKAHAFAVLHDTAVGPIPTDQEPETPPSSASLNRHIPIILGIQL